MRELLIPEAQVVALLARAAGKPLTAQEKILEVIPEARLAGLWERLPEPWGGLWPTVTMKTIWWPLTERTWAGLGIWCALSYLLLKNDMVTLGSKAVLIAVVAWLCWTFVVEQPIKPVWPKALVTVGDVARAMLSELQEQHAHWETVEREWGTGAQKRIEGASASLP